MELQLTELERKLERIKDNKVFSFLDIRTDCYFLNTYGNNEINPFWSWNDIIKCHHTFTSLLQLFKARQITMIEIGVHRQNSKNLKPMTAWYCVLNNYNPELQDYFDILIKQRKVSIYNLPLSL